MEKTLLLMLTLSGLSALSTHIIREYHYVQTSMTWAEAQSYCREKFTDLATVTNQDDNDMLLSVLQGPTKYAWIGLYDKMKKWKWALGNANFNYTFSYWNTNNPNNVHFKQTCTVMNEYGHWFDSNCWRPCPAACYYDQGPPSYILVKQEMTWYEAKTYCRSNYTDLVSVRNMSENNAIHSLLSAKTWIGLHRETWVYWSDQTNRTFTNWNNGQPDNIGGTIKSCAAVNTTTGTWLNVDCEAMHHFICQTVSYPPPQHKTTFKLKFQSEADLNDPAVQQQILEQLHAKLENHGLPDFKLHWIQTDGHTFHKEKGKKKEGSGG